MNHLFVDISAHGLGHLAQTAPVIAALRGRYPGLRLTVASGLTRDRLARRIAEPFAHIESAADFGFVMHNAIDIDFAASAERYRRFHADWAGHVGRYAGQLTALTPDLLLANAAYLPLAAAAQAGIPSVGFCSLNWADLFAHYFATHDWAAPIHAQMLAAYNAAGLFLRTVPAMPMSDFARVRAIGPIGAVAQRPRARVREQLAQQLGIAPDARWVLVAMGGMEFRLPVEDWPPLANVVWLCPGGWAVQRADVRAFDAPGQALPFTEILAASDVVLTKPGYGTFVEAACNGVPVLYLPRADWPEAIHLLNWLHAHGRIAAIERERLWAGDLEPALAELCRQRVPVRPLASGAQDAVAAIESLLAQRA